MAKSCSVCNVAIKLSHHDEQDNQDNQDNAQYLPTLIAVVRGPQNGFGPAAYDGFNDGASLSAPDIRMNRETLFPGSSSVSHSLNLSLNLPQDSYHEQLIMTHKPVRSEHNSSSVQKLG